MSAESDLDHLTGQHEPKQHQVVHNVQLLMEDVRGQGGSALVHHLVDPSHLLTTPQAEQTVIQIQDVHGALLKTPAKHQKQLPSPIVSPKELSKQWKILCKKAKEWCGLHEQTPSFVMMYLDDNKLVWEGPDHMESFISDENVISAFLRTAVATGSINQKSDAKRPSSSGQQTTSQSGYQPANQPAEVKYVMEHQTVSEAENTVVQALEQLGQMQPNQGNDGVAYIAGVPSLANQQTVVTTLADDSHAGSSGSHCTQPGQCGDDDDDEDDEDTADDSMNIDDADDLTDSQKSSQASGTTLINANEDGNTDVLSEVIDSVIKDWDPPAPVPKDDDGVRRSRSGRRIRPPGITVDTTVGTFEIVRNANKAKSSSSSTKADDDDLADDVKVISMNKSSPSSQYKQMGPCPECGKPISRNNLHAHMRIHKGEFRFYCQVCSKGFYTRKDMLIHYRIHTGERPFKCPVCFKSFRQKSKVKEHMLTHTGHKPHICTHCHHTFARRSDLKCHIRLHTGEKPYHCNECSKRFTQPGNFRAHLRTHSRDQRGHVFGPCDACGRTYSSLSSWKEHIRTHHAAQEAAALSTDLTVQHATDDETLEIQQVDATERGILVQQPDGQQILVDLSEQNSHGTITLNMADVAGVGEETEGELQTILIDEHGRHALQAGDGQVVMITEEQAARLGLTVGPQ